ncbi:MAG: phosphatase PAP2 family protein [Prevotellaceae bacterium]|jgi:hypothetical protein|nr:phosphatase PAP2 family protein [Prevotellaceae bacterium]
MTTNIKHSVLTFLVLILAVNQAFAQNDTLPFTDKSKNISIWAFAVPSAMISYGIITRFSSDLQNFDKKIDNEVLQNIHRKYSFDDYIQYTPYLGIYGLDLCGVKAKHNFLDRTLVLGSSIIICTSAVQITKHATGVVRPDGSNNHSFPSGHTATAFLGAHILFREYKDASPWIGIAGYGVAFTAGTMRIINRKHWFSDVLAGAGIGILSVEMSYLLLPVWHKLFKMKPNSNSLVISPIINDNFCGIGGILMF